MDGGMRSLKCALLLTVGEMVVSGRRRVEKTLRTSEPLVRREEHLSRQLCLNESKFLLERIHEI